MLDKLPQGWFRLYGVLQTRALAHGGELLYEVDLSAGGSFMQASRSLSQKPIQRVFAFWFYFWFDVDVARCKCLLLACCACQSGMAEYFCCCVD